MYLCRMSQMKNEIRYPVGIQSFKEIREGGYLYVDKTRYIRNLLKGKYYFLSRPRRFGKSLLLSTLEAFFEGNRDLFKELDIDSFTENWESSPVLHLDLNNRDYKDESSLFKELNETLEEWESLYGREKRDRDVEERFAYIIRKAYEKTGKKVVILVDEYDKPLLGCIDNPELAEKYRGTLKAFYSNLKTMDPYIRFAMLTGVARFSKISIFSDLNNLRDISFSDEFAAICGITQEELSGYFDKGIAALSNKYELDYEQTVGELRRRYDGYHFSEESPDIYNPFSLMNVFADLRLSNYWFASGTPTYLISLVNKYQVAFRDIAPVEYDAEALQTEGIFSGDLVPTFYQTGYLTIKYYDREYNTVTLDYPNTEVAQDFLRLLLWTFLPETRHHTGYRIIDFIKDVKTGNPESFMQRLQSLTASIPYQENLSAEAGFQNLVYLLFTLIGFSTKMEDRTSEGRIDIEVTTDEYIYLFELKVNSSAQNALRQIREKRYWLRHATGRRKIYLIGANFDTKSRLLDDWIIEQP